MPIWISIAITFDPLGRTCTKARRTRGNFWREPVIRRYCARACTAWRCAGKDRRKRGWSMPVMTIHTTTSQSCWCRQLSQCYRATAELVAEHTAVCTTHTSTLSSAVAVAPNLTTQLSARLLTRKRCKSIKSNTFKTTYDGIHNRGDSIDCILHYYIMIKRNYDMHR